jgi:hypothetical protein
MTPFAFVSLSDVLSSKFGRAARGLGPLEGCNPSDYIADAIRRITFR